MWFCLRIVVLHLSRGTAPSSTMARSVPTARRAARAQDSEASTGQAIGAGRYARYPARPAVRLEELPGGTVHEVPAGAFPAAD